MVLINNPSSVDSSVSTSAAHPVRTPALRALPIYGHDFFGRHAAGRPGPGSGLTVNGLSFTPENGKAATTSPSVRLWFDPATTASDFCESIRAGGWFKARDAFRALRTVGLGLGLLMSEMYVVEPSVGDVVQGKQMAAHFNRRSSVHGLSRRGGPSAREEAHVN